MKSTFLLTVEHDKPLPAEFMSMAEGRIYTMGCVDMVTAEPTAPVAEPSVSKEWVSAHPRSAAHMIHTLAVQLVKEREEATLASQTSKSANPPVKNFDALIQAGSMLSNIAFNLKQRKAGEALTQRDIDAMRTSQESWDKARWAPAVRPESAEPKEDRRMPLERIQFLDEAIGDQP